MPGLCADGSEPGARCHGNRAKITVATRPESGKVVRPFGEVVSITASDRKVNGLKLEARMSPGGCNHIEPNPVFRGMLRIISES